ncbi:MAG: formylglycine-generating enzyme family protein [Deltaproteobacteria bacterium]|nr:formylglycine-generating enzyme family protein [Deltaproteobacteria bacterium]
MKNVGMFVGLGFTLSMLVLSFGCGGSTADPNDCVLDSDCEDAQVCSNGRCVDPEDPCADIVCDDPPADTCDGDSLTTYQSSGTCSAGICNYAFVTVACDFGCVNGACHADPCLDIVCDDPPADTCDGDSLTTYQSSGTCSAGICNYASDTVACDFGCVNGACDADPCLDIVCDDPPADTCDGDSLTTYQSNGTCGAGICNYASDTVVCDFGCVNGACNADPCLDIVCDDPPADTCDGDSLMQYPETGLCDGGDCTYSPNLVNCPYGCADGVCMECTPDCLGKCGGADDGCDGTCTADCPAGQYCDNQLCAACTVFDACGEACENCSLSTAGHACINPSDDNYVCGCDTADDCGEGDVCNGNACCTPACVDKECGPDGCGGTCGPGCGMGETCDEMSGQCEVLPWLSITGGTFQMGSDAGGSNELPIHSVTVPSFEMSKTEVTVEQYQVCVDAGTCTSPDGNTFDSYCNWGYSDRGAHPVNCVDWDQAVAFCTWAGGRLPSEAEWEYAARSGGQDITYPWGDETATCEYAVMDDGGWGCGQNSTWAVCGKTDGNTDQGLCDMAGNIWEWVQDEIHGSYTGAPTDGSAWEDSGDIRVARGGSFYGDADVLRAACRSYVFPPYRYYFLGFRCAR